MLVDAFSVYISDSLPETRSAAKVTVGFIGIGTSCSECLNICARSYCALTYRKSGINMIASMQTKHSPFAVAVNPLLFPLRLSL